MLFIPILGYGQTNNEVWVDYDHTHLVTEKLSYFGDATFRTGDIYIIGIRPSVKYKWTNKLHVMGGVGNNYLFEPIVDSLMKIEVRPWQGVKAIWPQTSFFIVKHYMRVEEKLFTNRGEFDFDSSVKLRYQLGLDIDVWENDDGLHSFNIPIEYEVFHTINSTDGIIQRDRTVLGIGYSMKNHFVFEFNYIHQRSGEGYSDLHGQTNIFRFRFRKTFSGRIKDIKHNDL